MVYQLINLGSHISSFANRKLYSGNVANNDSIVLASNNCAFYIITFVGRGISTIIPYTVTRALLYGCVPDSNAYLHASVTFSDATHATIKYKYGPDWSGSSESLEIYGYGVR